MRHYKKHKKAINSVVSVTLLLVVTIIAVVSFQNWLKSYSNITNAQAEIESNTLTTYTGIESVYNNDLYFRSNFNNITIKSIKIDGTTCYSGGNNFPKGTHNISISTCTSTLATGTYEIVVHTDRGLFTNKKYIKT